jgi:hypothetical protein
MKKIDEKSAVQRFGINKTIKLILVVLFIFFIFAGICVQAQMTEEAKIEYLINSVNDVPEGSKFIRNGTKHNTAAAADHLRTKYKRGKKYAKTAVDFIENIASKSSVSGKEYFIEFPDNKTITAKDFFTNNLKKLENNAKNLQ